jgi:hypothetical protein
LRTLKTTVAAAVWMAATATTIGFAAPAHADPTVNPPVGPCDGHEIAVAAGWAQPGLGHRAVQLNFTLQSGASPCQLSGYPAVDAEVDVEGAALVHAEQTPSGYLGGAVPGATVTLGPGHDAHAMLEWVASPTLRDPTCPTYPTHTDVRLHVTPPGTSQTLPSRYRSGETSASAACRFTR